MSTPNFQITTQNAVQSDANLPDDSTEYERFEDLARKLLSVSKAEVEAEKETSV